MADLTTEQERRPAEGEGTDRGNAVFVFSQSCPLGDVVSLIRQLPESMAPVCVTTHSIFDSEADFVAQGAGRHVVFLDFADLMTEDEMLFCDQEGDRLTVERFGGRDGHLGYYYALIKRLKNEKVVENLERRFPLQQRFLLSEDLGIDREVWIEKGFDAVIRSDGSGEPDADPRVRRGRFARTVSYLVQRPVVHDLRGRGENYLIFGRIDRIADYLHPEVKATPVSWLRCTGFLLLYKISGSRLRPRVPGWLYRPVAALLSAMALPGRIRQNCEAVLVPIHEQDGKFSGMAENLGLPMYYMQDGFLPDNYSSAYLKYRRGVDTYLVWDPNSRAIFTRFGLQSRVSRLYASQEIRQLPEQPVKIARILAIASGAGDWTAKKNRSDEDRMIKLFVEVARSLPDVHVLYRPHPLWANPMHQGRNSIIRVRDYIRGLNLPNFTISVDAVEEGEAFTKDGIESRKTLSIYEEIRQADFVFGDHSQAMIAAGQMGTPFGSVNATRRTSFFESYNRLGFPHFTTAAQVVDFIHSLPESAEPMAAYNLAVRKYNQSLSNAGVAE